MICLLGDIHGIAYSLDKAINDARKKGATALIQLGDFQLYLSNPSARLFYEVVKKSPIPVYFIDGNHDDCTHWKQYNSVTRIWDDANLWYVPRGTVMDIDGHTIAFMGGAGSIDKQFRLQHGYTWDENENISPNDVSRIIENANGKQIDMLLTHCPPNSVVNKHFDPVNKLLFGVGLDWHDPNQDVIEDIWSRFGHPMLYCGHMHRSVHGQTYRILNIDELVCIPAKS